MLLSLLRTITDFAVLMARLTTGEFADEQRLVLIDQFMDLQGFDAAFEFDLHDLLMILIPPHSLFVTNICGRIVRCFLSC